MRFLSLQKTCVLSLLSLSVLIFSCKGKNNDSDPAPAPAPVVSADDPQTAADVASVTAAKEALTLENAFTFGTGDSAAAVTQSFTLSVEGLETSVITWTSSNAEVIAVAGNQATVVRPAADTEVTLTATITKGESSVTKELVVTVKAEQIALHIFGSVSENNIRIPTHWINEVPSSLPVPFAGKNASARMGFRVASDLYILGFATNTSDLTVTGYWKNNVWTGLTSPDPSRNCIPGNMVNKGTDIYVTGNCSVPSLNGATSPGYWKNGTWTDLPRLDPTLATVSTSISVIGDDVYIAGSGIASGTLFIAGYWKNDVWTALPAMVTNKRCSANIIKMVGADLNVYGTCDNSGNNQVIGFWKNGVWNSITDANGAQPCPFGSVFQSNSNIYVTGSCGVAGSYWLDGVKTDMTVAAGASSASPSGIFVDTDIYIVGAQVAGVTRTGGYWKNNVWTALPGTAVALGVSKF